MARTVDPSRSLRSLLEAVAERLAEDDLADPPPSAELIAACVLGLSPARLVAEADRPPTVEERACLQERVARVATGEPAAYRNSRGESPHPSGVG
jgi:hypothetical protein